jgi:TonB family protein
MMSKNIFAACLVISIVFHTIIAAFLISHKTVPKNISDVPVQQVSLIGSLKFLTDVVNAPESNNSFRRILKSKQKDTTSRAENLQTSSNSPETTKTLDAKAGNLSESSQTVTSAKPLRENLGGNGASISEPEGTGKGNNKGEENYTHAGNALTAAKGEIIKARLLNGPNIHYDETSRRRGEEGRVSILLEVDRSGNPRNVRLAGSSGYPRLDRIALNGIRSSRFSPTMKSGRPVDSQIEYIIIFRLDDMNSDLKVVEDDSVNILE